MVPHLLADKWWKLTFELRQETLQTLLLRIKYAACLADTVDTITLSYYVPNAMTKLYHLEIEYVVKWL